MTGQYREHGLIDYDPRSLPDMQQLLSDALDHWQAAKPRTADERRAAVNLSYAASRLREMGAIPPRNRGLALTAGNSPAQ